MVNETGAEVEVVIGGGDGEWNVRVELELGFRRRECIDA